MYSYMMTSWPGTDWSAMVGFGIFPWILGIPVLSLSTQPKDNDGSCTVCCGCKVIQC